MKLYKIGFWILLITAFTFFNLWRIVKNNYQNDIKRIEEVNERRIASLMVSNSIGVRVIDSVNGENIITHEIRKNLLQNTSLVILLSTFKCDKCQEKELKRLNSLKKNIELHRKKINVVGLTIKSKMDVVIRERKITRIDFPIYMIDDYTFFNKLAFSKEFPEILLIAKNVVISGFIPIPKDDNFSKKYFTHIIESSL